MDVMMKKCIEIVVVCIITGFIIVLIGVAALLYFVHPNDFKTVLKSIVENKTHRTLSIQGDLHWSLSGGLNIKVNGISLSRVKGEKGETPFLTIQEAKIGLKILPLFFKKIIFNKLVLKYPVLNITETSSVTLLADRMTDHTQKNRHIHDRQVLSRQSRTIFPQLFFDAITVEQGAVYYFAEHTEPVWIISNIDFKGRNLKAKSMFPVKLAFMMRSEGVSRDIHFSLKTKLYADFDQKIFKLVGLHATIDEATLHGDADFMGLDPHTLNVNLKTNLINLDHYFSLFAKDVDTSTAQVKQIERTKLLHKFDIPNGVRSLTMKGHIQLKGLRYHQMQCSSVDVTVSHQSKDPFHAALQAICYQGAVYSKLNLAKDNKGKLIVKERTTIKGLQIGRLLKDAFNHTSFLSGQLNLQQQTNTAVYSWSQWLGNMNGAGSFEILNGKIPGMNVLSFVQKSINFLKQNTKIIPDIKQSTTFETVKGTYRIRQGVLYNNDFLLLSAALQINGKGKINWVQDNIQYRFNIMSQHKLTLPVLITGRLSDPKIRIDAASLLRTKVGDAMTQQAKQLFGQLKLNQ
jgi:uncharacterized protein involved in outer membrane biogenesis